MARFLALDWDHQQLHVVAAVVRGSQVRVERAVVWQEEGSPNVAEAEALGRLLRDRLKAAGIAPAPVLACVGRERVILKDVRYPPVPAAEEPGIVRFQAVKELTDAPEEVVLDYTPAGEVGGEHRALVLVARRELVAAYQTLCKAAGLKLLALTPRPFGVTACLPGPERRSGPAEVRDAVAVLAVADRWAELAVAGGERLLQARALPPGTALAGEVRRSLAVFSAQAFGQTVRALYLADGGDGVLAERLRQQAGVPVHPLDPFAGLQGTAPPAAERGAFAAAVGLLRLQAGGRPLPVNFIQPKEPKRPTDPNQRQVAVAAAVAVLLLVGLIGFCYARLAARDRRLRELTATKVALDGQLATLEEDAQRIAALNDWDEGGICWLDELYDLTVRFPDPRTIRLARFTADPRSGAAKDRYVARMVLNGVSTADDPVDALITALAEDRHYRVGPKQMTSNSGPDRSQFLEHFTTHIEVEKVPPSHYTRRLVVPLPRHALPMSPAAFRPAPAGLPPETALMNAPGAAAAGASPPVQPGGPGGMTVPAPGNAPAPSSPPGAVAPLAVPQASPPAMQASPPAASSESAPAPSPPVRRRRSKGENP